MNEKNLIINSIMSNIQDKRYETKTEYYKIGKVIGKGAFGRVFLIKMSKTVHQKLFIKDF